VSSNKRVFLETFLPIEQSENLGLPITGVPPRSKTEESEMPSSPLSIRPLITSREAFTGLDHWFYQAAHLDRVGICLLRLGLVVVLVWIGGLKFANYEADSIVPMVANNPLMRFFYHYRAPEYRNNMNREGEFNPAHREWHPSNGTYVFSHGLGIVILLIGLSIAMHPLHPKTAAIGSFALIFMALTTLPFLITTPEAWVQPLGDIAYGFPYLSGLGRLIIKDAIVLGAAVVTMADSARSYLRFQ
jgi:uncharacterized membrane protein YkgB